MRTRPWAIIAGLGVAELWIVGLILRSISGTHGPALQTAAPATPASLAVPAAETAGGRTIETGAAPHVVIDDDGASLTVTVRDGTLVAISDTNRRSGWIRSFAGALSVARTRDGVRIAGDGAGNVMFMGAAERRLDVVVPPAAQVDVINAGRIVMSGLRAAATLHADDGPVTVSDHRGELHVSADDGRIELHDVDGSEVDVDSNDGRIGFDRVRADDVRVTTNDGRIDIEQSLLRGGKIHTNDGRVTLGLDPRSDVTVAAQTSGQVAAQSPFTVAAGSADDDDAPSTVRLGGGTGRLEVGSNDGSISIRAGEYQPS